MASDTPRSAPTQAQILAFLSSHPDQLGQLLASHPDFLELCLATASKRTGDSIDSNIVNLIPTLATKARAEARQLRQKNQSLLHVVAENMLSWTRLHHAALALLSGIDLASMGQVIHDEFPSIFDLSQCQLVIGSHAKFDAAQDNQISVHSETVIATALRHKSLYLGPPNDAANQLLAMPAKSLAIIRLPDRLPNPVSSCALILGGKTISSFRPDLGSDLLVLLAEMVGVTLAARLEAEGVSDG
jgi:uncharacterized protein YigA (DUF484 family)